MFRKLLFGAGMAYMARRFMGGRRSMAMTPRSGVGFGRRGW